MADQTFEHNNGRPHHDTGEIGDWLNSLSDQQYWAAHGAWYQNPQSEHMSFEEHVRTSDAGLREQARYDEANAARRKHRVRICSRWLADAYEEAGRHSAARPQTETQDVRAESPDSLLSDDSLYRSPSPRRGDPAQSSDSHRRHPGRFEDEDLEEEIRPTERAAVYAVTPAGVETDALDDEAFARLLANPPPAILHEARPANSSDPNQGDALDDEVLARLLANPPPEMLEQAIRAAIPGALDDEALERLLEKQREDIYEGQWRDLIREAPSADHLSDEDLERFLANEREKLFSGETEAFSTAHHTDAISDEDLVKVIAGLGFEHRPLVQSEHGESSRPRPPFSNTSGLSSGYSVPPAQSTPPGTLPPDYAPETAADRSRAFDEALTPEPVSNAERLYQEQKEERRRRQNAIQRRRDAEQEAERDGQTETVKSGKQPERYYE